MATAATMANAETGDRAAADFDVPGLLAAGADPEEGPST